MKKNLIFVLSLFLFVTFGWMVSPGLSAENPRILVPDWIEYWGGNDTDYAHSVFVDDGDIYVGGLTSRYGTSGGFDAILLKYDTGGKILWNRTWGGKDIDLVQSVYVASKTIYVAGTTKSYGEGDKEAFLLKYDINGTLLWNRTWGGSENDTAHSVFADGAAVYVAGETEVYGTGYYDAFLLKYNMSGTLLWNQTWGGSAKSVFVNGGAVYVTGKTIKKSAGSGLVLMLNDAEEDGAFLLKYDSAGNLLWHKTWGSRVHEEANAVFVDGEGVYVVGETESHGSGRFSDAILLKYDVDGNLHWNKTWGWMAYNNANTVFVEDGVIYIGGHTQDMRLDVLDAILLKYDSNGNLLWDRIWGRRGYNEANSIVVENGTIYMGGLSSSNRGETSDVFLLKYGGTAVVPEDKGIPLVPLLVAIIGAIIFITALIIRLKGHSRGPQDRHSEQNHQKSSKPPEY